MDFPLPIFFPYIASISDTTNYGKKTLGPVVSLFEEKKSLWKKMPTLENKFNKTNNIYALLRKAELKWQIQEFYKKKLILNFKKRSISVVPEKKTE